MLLSLLLALIACDNQVGNCVDNDGDGVGVGATCGDVDCDDNDPTVQVCGGDNDGETDQDADRDADGYPAAVDCDDTDPTVNGGAEERCDGVDNDCNNLVDDDATDAALFHTDADGDGYGDPAASLYACTQPEGTVPNGADCDDTDSAAAPGLDEICDGVDNDCNDLVDDDATDAGVWYADSDADGFGDSDAAQTACVQPDNTVANGDDCDDSTETIAPDKPEVCNDVDDDCSGVIDDDPVDLQTFFADVDGDGAGNEDASTTACTLPADHVEVAGDCDDNDPARSPLADEVCNNLDDDCDDLVDNEAIDGSEPYPDDDLDGFGDETAAPGPAACTADPGWSFSATDCDDANPEVHPEALDFPGDGSDDNCDGVDLPSGDGDNQFYVSGNGDDTNGDGTQLNPYKTIGEAVRKSVSGDWIHIDAGFYDEAITEPRHYIGSYDSFQGWSRDVSSGVLTIVSPIPGPVARVDLSSGAQLTLAGINMTAAPEAIVVTSDGTGQVLIVDDQIYGRLTVDKASVGMKSTYLSGSEHAVVIAGTAETRTLIEDCELEGVFSGLWIKDDATVRDSVLRGTNGFTAFPDRADVYMTFERVEAVGSTKGASFRGVTAKVVDSKLVSEAQPPASTNVATGASVTSGDVTFIRSHLSAGDHTLSASPFSFFYGLEVESNANVTVLNSTLLAVSGFESNTQAIGLFDKSGASTTVVGSTVVADAQGGVMAWGVRGAGGPITLINTAIDTTGGQAGNQHGVVVGADTKSTLHNVAFDSRLDTLVAVALQPSGLDRYTTIAEVEACTWGACVEAKNLLRAPSDFTAPTTGDFSLQSTSALINKGVDPTSVDPGLADLPYDIDYNGIARPQGGVFDIGAYEAP